MGRKLLVLYTVNNSLLIHYLYRFRMFCKRNTTYLLSKCVQKGGFDVFLRRSVKCLLVVFESPTVNKFQHVLYYLLIFLPRIYLFTYSPTYLPPYLPTYLPIYLSIHLSSYYCLLYLFRT